MEDGPRNDMVTSHRDSYPVHPVHRVPPAQPSPGGIATAMPMGGPSRFSIEHLLLYHVFFRVFFSAPLEGWASETTERFQKWPLQGNRLLPNAQVHLFLIQFSFCLILDNCDLMVNQMMGVLLSNDKLWLVLRISMPRSWPRRKMWWTFVRRTTLPTRRRRICPPFSPNPGDPATQF